MNGRRCALVNKTVEAILNMYKNHTVMSILESSRNYIIAVCGKNIRADSAVDTLFAMNKKTGEISEFSYFANPDEYAEACENVLYRKDDMCRGTSEDLAHHGIKGMRWGIRRFQKKDGSLTPDGKKRYAKNPSDDESEEPKPNNTAKKNSSESESPEDYEARKQKAIKSGGVDEVLEFKNDLTHQQRVEAYNRIQWEQSMKNLAPNQVDAGKSKADKFFENVNTITGYADTCAKAWNTFANVYNAFSDSDVSLPKIDRNLTNGNRETRKAEKLRKKAAGGGT